MSNELYRGVLVVNALHDLMAGGVVVQSNVPLNRYYYTKAYTKKSSARQRLTVLRKVFKTQDIVEWYTERVSAWERVDD